MIIPNYIKEPAVFLLAILSVIGWGSYLADILISKSKRNLLEKLALCLAGGMVVISYILLFAGFIGLLDNGLGGIISIIGLSLLLIKLWERRKSLESDSAKPGTILIREEPPKLKFKRFDYLLLSLITISTTGIFVFHLLGCMLPDFGGDSMNYHLSIPKLYLMQGKIYGIPNHCHANMYLGASMVYLYCLTLFDEWGVVCKLTQFAQVIGTFLFVFLIIKELLSKISDRQKKEEPVDGQNVFIFLTSLIGACLFLYNLFASHYRAPLHVRSDLTAMFYLTAGLYILIAKLIPASGIQAQNETDNQAVKYENWKSGLRYFIFAGIFLAASASVKYTAITFGVIPIFCALFFIKFRFNKRSDLYSYRRILFLGLVIFAVLLPWIMRSFMTTGSPMFPAFEGMIKDEYKPALIGVAEYQKGHQKDIIEAEKNPGTFYSYQKNKMVSAIVEGDFLLLVIPFLSLLYIFNNIPALAFLGATGLISFFFFLFTPIGQIQRLYVIVSPITATLLASLLFMLLKKIRYRTIILLLTFLVSLNNLIQHQRSHSALPNVNFYGAPVFDAKKREQYVIDYCYLHEDIFPVYDYMKRNLPKQCLVYLVEQPLSFYCPRPFITRDHWNPKFHLESLMLKQAGSLQNLALIFKQKGITHILINTDEKPFTDFDLFMEKYAKLLFENRKSKLYKFSYRD